MAQIPERLVNFRCFGGAGATELIGMTDVELPKFEAMTEKISGAGIAGEYDSPVLGHFGSMTVKLKWRAVNENQLSLLAPVLQVLDLRGSIQIQDPGLGQLLTQALRVEVRGQLKSGGLGKFEPGKPMETETEIEVATIRISLEGVPKIELDKFSSRFVVDGVDYLQKVRIDTGGV